MTSDSAARFRVSDALIIPLRGFLLRLKLVEGAADIAAFKPGSRLRLLAPDGTKREVTVKGFSETGGRQTQERLDRLKELDLVIAQEDAIRDGVPIDIGWEATAA